MTRSMSRCVKANMIKILYIVSTLQRCGPTQQLFNLIKYLDRKYCRPDILTLSKEPHDSSIDEFIRLGIPVSSLKLDRFTSFFRAQGQIHDYISQHKPDIIHSNGFRADIFSARIRDNVHTMTTLRNHLFENYAYDFGWAGKFLIAPIHLRMFHRIEKAITVSQTLSKRLSEDYGFACDVVPNGVDQEFFFPVETARKLQIRTQLGLPLDHRIFSVMGYLSALKDPVCVAEGFLKAAIPDATLIFLGDGVMRKKLELLSKTGNILLTGRVKDVKTYLQASDFLISGSHTEGMPNAVLEAMACGLPCILSDIRAHREIARYSPASTRLFRVKDAQNLADKIREVLDQDYVKMSCAAFEAVNQNFSAKIMSKNYLYIYKSILNQKQTPAGETQDPD